MFLLALTFPAVGRAGGEVGNGGDSVVQEFLFLGQETIKFLPFLQTKVVSKEQLARIESAIRITTDVESKDRLFLGEREVEAINYPSKMKIEVSRSWWLSPGNEHREFRWMLVLHEYLWLSGIDDSGYQVSNPLFVDLMAARRRWLSTPIAKALTQAVCGAVWGRDKATIESALKLGADLESLCDGGSTVTFACADGTIQTIGMVSPQSPLVEAIETMGTNYCAHKKFDPGVDVEMQEILGLLLSFHPDLAKKDYGPFHDETLLNIASRKDRYLAYTSLIAAGINLNSNLDFGGLLRWWPFASERFFKAALDAGADINQPLGTSPNVIQSAHILARAPEAVMKLFVSQGKIDFCVPSGDPSFPNDSRKWKLFDLAKPEFKAYLRGVGGPCIP